MSGVIYTKMATGRVMLEMEKDDYSRLILALGMAAGCAMKEDDRQSMWHWVAFANRLNAGNPEFVPYQLPPEFSDENQLQS